MASYDPYERDRDYAPRRNYTRERERDDRRDDRFLDVRDSPRVASSRDLVPRPREDSDLSIEEVRRDFPPPSGRDIGRARSAEPAWGDDYYDRRRGYDPRYDRDRDYDRRPRRAGSYIYEEEEHKRSKHKGMTKQEKIFAALAGAVLVAGGKEMYDRREAKEGGGHVQRNPLSSVALAGVGALAGYQGAEFYSKQQAKKDQKATYILHRGRDGHVSEYYSDDDEDPKERKGHKNFLESALAATGLGAAVKTLTGGGGDDKRSARGSPNGSRAGSRAGSRDRGGGGANKIQKAAMASLLAGATEAFRVAKEPGGWKGEKTKRILTVAAGAATVDAAHGENHGKLGLLESVIGGLVGNRLINGSKKDIEEDEKTGRSRSRSRARSSDGGKGRGATGLAALATAGLGALGAKKVLDHSRSRSRSRGRPGSDYSRSPSRDRRRERSRSRSVVDKARNSLAKLGIGAGAGAAAEDYRRRDQDDFDDRGSSRGGGSRRYHDDYYDDDRGGYGRHERSRGGGGGGRERSRSRSRRGGRSDYTSESDLGDSDEDEKRAKKMRGKQVITTGLATVATIHAAHNVYQSMEKRNARQRAVKEGRLTAAEAKKLKTKAIMQDAASVGIAAMGIKGALEEMKEAKELNHECKEFQTEKQRRHERRLERRKRQLNKSDSSRRSDSWSTPSRLRYDEEDDWSPHPRPRYYDDGIYTTGPPLPPPGPPQPFDGRMR